MSWPISRCPLSTQQCTILFFIKKTDKLENTLKCTKIKENTTSKKELNSPPPWFSGSIFDNKSPKAKLTWSHHNSLSAYFLFWMRHKNCARAQLESLRGEEGFVKQTWWSKISDLLALPGGQGYSSLQMTSRVMDQTMHAESAFNVWKGEFTSMSFGKVFTLGDYINSL